MRGLREKQILCTAFLGGVSIGVFLCFLTFTAQRNGAFQVAKRLARGGGKKTPPNVGSEWIPKIIHQTWKDRFVPSSLTSSILSWRKHHPDWQYWFWTENGFTTLMDTKYKKFSKIYYNLPYRKNREELQRYIIMHEYGGFYAQMDLESLRPLDPLLEKYKCIISKSPEEHTLVEQCDKYTKFPLSNALFGCASRHPFFRLLLEMLPVYVSMAGNQALTGAEKDPTGQCMLAEVLSLYLQHFNKSKPEYIQVAEPEVFLPTFKEDYLYQMESRCQDTSGLTRSQKNICTAIMAKEIQNAPSPISYTMSHWHNLYNIHDLSAQAVEKVLSKRTKTTGKQTIT